MSIAESLRREASKNFELPGFGSGAPGSGRARAGGMAVVFYPNGLSCWQVNAYLIHCHRIGLKMGTIATYASELSLFVRFLHKQRLVLDSIDGDHLVDFSDWLASRGESSNRHINRILARVMTFLFWADCISPPTGQVPPGNALVAGVGPKTHKFNLDFRPRGKRHAAMLPSGARRIVRPMPVAVFHDLLAECPRSAKGSFCRARNRIILLLLADTGIRREELIWIRVSDVEVALKNGGRMSVRTSKRNGNPLREVPVPEFTLREVTKFVRIQRALLLRRHQKAGRYGRERGWLICTESGGQLAPSSVTQLFSYLRRLAGLSERATAHMLRHRYITLQVMDRIKRLRTVGVLGVEAASTVLAQVASLSGHSSPSSMWDYIDWAYQEMAVSAEGRGDSELQSLINELEVLRGCAEQRSGDSQLLLRVQAALKSLLGSAPKLGVLAHQAGRSGRTG